MAESTFNVEDVCKRYQVSQNTVLAWIANHELRAVNVAPRAGSKRPKWRITPEALASFEAARTPATPAPKTERRLRRQAADVIAFYPTNGKGVTA